jgi:hypothetical protein
MSANIILVTGRDYIKKYKGTNEQGEFVQRRPRVYSHTVSAIPFLFVHIILYYKANKRRPEKSMHTGNIIFYYCNLN